MGKGKKGKPAHNNNRYEAFKEQSPDSGISVNKNGKDKASVSIYVGNLDDDIDENDLKAAFEYEILNVKVVRDPITNITNNYGFIHFTNKTDAENAIREMQGKMLKTRPIKTDWDKRSQILKDYHLKLEELVKMLENVYGQIEFKQLVFKIAKSHYADRVREKFGVYVRTRSETIADLHCKFTGNPGCGKTMLARCYADILKAIGLIEKDKPLIIVQRPDLVDNCIGGTEKKTKHQIDKAMGGAMLVDEAYRLNGSGNDFGPVATETIMEYLEPNVDSSKQNPVFAFSGYTKEMEEFDSSNDGLNRRIKNKVPCPDFSVEDLTGLTMSEIDRMGMHLEKDFDRGIISGAFAKLSTPVLCANNATLVYDLIKHVRNEQDDRVLKLGDGKDNEQKIRTFTQNDFIKGIAAFIDSKSTKEVPQDKNKVEEITTLRNDFERQIKEIEAENKKKMEELEHRRKTEINAIQEQKFKQFNSMVEKFENQFAYHELLPPHYSSFYSSIVKGEEEMKIKVKHLKKQIAEMENFSVKLIGSLLKAKDDYSNLLKQLHSRY